MDPVLSKRLTEVKKNAALEAVSMGHGFMSTEHILLGLLSVPDSQAYDFLNKRGFTLKKMRQIIFSRMGVSKNARPIIAADDEEPLPESEPQASLPTQAADADAVAAGEEEQGEIVTISVMPSLRALAATKAACELAQSYNKPVNTLHMLWGILLDAHSPASLLLQEMGVDPEKWTDEIQELLSDSDKRRPQVLSFRKEKGKGKLSATSQDAHQLLKAKEEISKNLVGQEEAIGRIADTLTRSWAGLTGTGHPMASFLFVGPRGSGKQTLAHNIARFIYGDSERVLRLNLDNFSDEARATCLLGEPIGGETDPQGFLTGLAQEYPASIIYLEDVDKAHPKAMEGIHQILERGYALNGKKERVEFRDNILILSIVVDPEFFERDAPVGFRLSMRDCHSSQESYERSLMPDLERILRADTLALVDEVIFFPPFTTREMNQLIDAWTKELNHELNERHRMGLSLGEGVAEYLIARAQEIGQGAGDLRRVFKREIHNRIAQALLKEEITHGFNVKVEMVDNVPVVRKGTRYK